MNKVTAPPSTKIPIALPKNVADGRILFYGYDITSEWVLNYAETHYKKAKEQGKLAQASIGAQLLKICTGINGLHFESALVDREGDRFIGFQ